MEETMFGCSMCSALCCSVPPEMTTEEEVQFAIESGAEVLAVEKDGVYLIAIAQQNGVCPFLDNGECSVYDNRFLRCRQFNCVAQTLTPTELLSEANFKKLPSLLGTPRDGVAMPPVFFDRDFVDGNNIKVVSVEEAIEKINTVNTGTVLDFLVSTVASVSAYAK